MCDATQKAKAVHGQVPAPKSLKKQKLNEKTGNFHPNAELPTIVCLRGDDGREFCTSF
jgi:hypothetical protein